MYFCILFYLHLLIGEERIDNLLNLEIWDEFEEIRWTRKPRSIRIPDLNNIVSSLGADGNTVDLIGGIGRNPLEHKSNRIVRKGLAGIGFQYLETVAAAIDIRTVFPEGRNGILEEEEHAVTERGDSKGICEFEKVCVTIYSATFNKGCQIPLLFVNTVIPERITL